MISRVPDGGYQRSDGSRTVLRRLMSDVCHPIPAPEIVNHDGPIIVSSFKHALKTYRRGWSLLHHVSRPMKLVRTDPFACVAKHETMATRQPRNGAQPVRCLGPPHLDTGHPWPHRRDAHVDQFRLGAPRSLRRPKPRHQPGDDPARGLRSAVLQQSTRITGIIHPLSRAVTCGKAILECGRFRLP